jgi:calcium-dependent protein kinase
MLGKKTPALHEHYDMGSLLGTGQFATTRVAVNKQTGQKLACKSISKAKLPTPSHVADVRREIQIMKFLSGHPNVVTFHGVYEDKQYIHIVMELCEGGDLFDKIFAKGHYTEQDAARIIRAIMTVSI